MKKITKILITVLMITIFTIGCGGSNPAVPAEPIRLEESGLSFALPSNWQGKRNLNLLPQSYVTPEGEVYSKIEYRFAPDENMEELNNPDSITPIEQLLAPVFTFLVVREEHLESDSVLDTIDYYNVIEELPSQGDFHFFFLSDYDGNISYLSKSALKTYESLQKDILSISESIETFPPDEASVLARIEEDSQYLNFMTTTLDGDHIDSSVFYDYDMTILNFWASYAYPDINELDELQKFYEELQITLPNVNFIQVIIDAPNDKVEDVIAQAYKDAGVTFTGISPDPNMANWIIENLNGLPTTIFVDNTGKPTDNTVEGIQSSEYYMDITKIILEKLTADEE